MTSIDRNGITSEKMALGGQGKAEARSREALVEGMGKALVL